MQRPVPTRLRMQVGKQPDFPAGKTALNIEKQRQTDPAGHEIPVSNLREGIPEQSVRQEHHQVDPRERKRHHLLPIDRQCQSQELLNSDCSQQWNQLL